MGLRGPGAKPVSRNKIDKILDEEFLIIEPKPWEADGLSKSEQVILFVETLKITAGARAGEQFRLRDWQKDLIRRVYDPVKPDGRRQVRTALLTLPRKNGKTTLIAALAICHLCGPMAEPRGAIYSAAADRNQAAILFREMKAMLLADPELSARIIIRDFVKELEDSETGSIYDALSADVATKFGFSASFVCFDELAQSPNRDLYDVLETSVAARAEPLFVIISTQSSDPRHIMSEVVDYGRDVLAGIVDDPSFVAAIYEAPPEADIWSEDVWRAANPALGDFRDLDEMRSYAARARRLPAKQVVFRNLYLNQRVDPSAGFISGTDWLACGDPVDEAELAGSQCFGGLDLSSTRDLTSLALWFPASGSVLVKYWIPGSDLDEREHVDRAPYRLWVEQGLISAPSGRAIDKRAVAQDVVAFVEQFDLVGLAYDRWRIEDFIKILNDDGLVLPLIPWGQGFKDMSGALDSLEDLVIDRKLKHGAHPILTWNVSNAILDVDPAGSRKLNKRRARARIDGLQALCMAVGLAARQPDDVEIDLHPIVVAA